MSPTRGMLDLTDHGDGLARCCAQACGWEGVPTYIDGVASTYCPSCETAPEVDRELASWDAVPTLTFPEPHTSSKVARNAPCPCGSGRKAKKCCH